LPRWRPGLAPVGLEGAAEHREIFASAHEASGAGLALALALDEVRPGEDRPWLWVQDKTALRRTGRPYRPGLPPALRHRLIHVAAQTPEDALFALEEGLRCRDLAFVLGEIAGNPKALNFTASRRLSLAAEKHGTPLWLVRLDAGRDLSSARMRWAARPAPSLPPRWDAHAPGQPAWHAELFRARAYPPGAWILTLPDPLPHRGRGYEDLRACSLVAVGEGRSALAASRAPLQAPLAGEAALSPPEERVSA
jgi:protein ImuA